jgi:adenosylmethionine-8-amino-7-oxononanoate aminotransferase
MSAAAVDAFWMPFTANRDFKQHPRIITGASGHYYIAADGTRLYDTFSGLWTSGVGHCHPKIVEAVQTQVASLDYCMTFQMRNDKPFALAERVIEMAPAGFSSCFLTNSGSESVDSALKIALAYHRARGEGNRTRLIGREKGYHGVNFYRIARRSAPTCFQASIIFDTRSASKTTHSLENSPNGVPTWPMISRGSPRCTMAATSRPSSSSLSQVLPASSRRHTATCKNCARSVTATASC